MKKFFTLFAAFALVAAFTVPAMAAADWNFYGSARMTTFVESDDPPGDADSDTDTTWTLQGNSRLGAKVKTSDDIGGGFEFGVKGDSGGNGIYTRKLFGVYNFGDSQILVGQTYTPVSGMFYSNQVWGGDNDLLNCGQAYAGRRPMLRYKIKGFQVALVQPNTVSIAGLEGGDTDVILPKIEAKYRLKQEKFFMDIYAGYQTWSVEFPNDPARDKDYDVNAFAAGIGGGANFGPAFFKANVYFARNGGAFGLAGMGNDDPTFSTTDDDIVDVDTIGALGLIGVKAGEGITIEGGVGYISHERDVDNSEKDDGMQAYLNCSIDITKGFFVVPEVGFIDYGDDHAGNEEGEMTYFGAKWQINF